MADAAHAWTDDEIAQMEARLMRMYRRAEREMIATWREYMEKYARDIEGAFCGFGGTGENKYGIGGLI